MERERVRAGHGSRSEDEVSRGPTGRSSVHLKTIDGAAMENKGRLSTRLSNRRNSDAAAHQARAADVKEVELDYLKRVARRCPPDVSFDRDGGQLGTATRQEYPRRYLDVLRIRSWKDDDRDRIALHRCHRCCLRECVGDRWEEDARRWPRLAVWRLRDTQRAPRRASQCHRYHGRLALGCRSFLPRHSRPGARTVSYL